MIYTHPVGKKDYTWRWPVNDEARELDPRQIKSSWSTFNQSLESKVAESNKKKKKKKMKQTKLQYN